MYLLCAFLRFCSANTMNVLANTPHRLKARPTFSAAPLASNSPERTRLTALSFCGLDCGGMMKNLRVRGEERFQNRHETITRLSNGKVSQLTTSRDFEQ